MPPLFVYFMYCRCFWFQCW